MRRALRLLVLALAVSAAGTGSAAADARDARDWGRVALDLGLGFLGEQVENGSDPDLAMTLTATARVEKPVSRAFSFGGLVSTGFWRTETQESDDVRRWARIDADLIFKPRYAWRAGNGHMEIGLVLPVGFTLQGDNEEAGYNRRGIGYNVGALASWQWFPNRHVGFLTEFGWKRHQTWHDPGELVLQELMLDVGLAFLFH